MDKKSPDISPQLQAAFTAGDVYLVNEDAQPVEFTNTLAQRCWAHLRDVEDGKFYVQELRGSRELLHPRYLEMLGIV